MKELGMGKTRDLALFAAGASLARPRTEYVERGPREVHHHEHRAPTDKSVELLKEMEAAARDKVEETIRIEGNGFNAVVHLMREHFDDTLRARVIFDLNGRKMTVDHSTSALAATGPAALRAKLLTELRDKIAQEVANVVLLGAFEASPGSFNAVSSLY